MIRPSGIAFALYPVSDIARARRFYAETIGLAACMEMEFAPGRWWMEFDAGGPSALAITNYKMPGVNTTPTAGIAIEVEDYDGLFARLKERGVAITWGPNEFPACRCFAVKDPDGNDLYFHRRKAAP
ncbi:MAG: glyoxalase [Opitutus sp.]|nr:glyoxalase [Opitutus sp.]